MDELTAALSGSFQVTVRPNNPDAPHPRYAQYKVKGNVPDQQERRRRMLEQQKQNRFDVLNHIRRLADNQWDDVETNKDDEAESEEMETEVQVRKPGRRYKNQLMLSEWLVEVPPDFTEEWLMKPCPVGKRSLIVASKGVTSAYAKSGFRINSFPSCLPGGNRRKGYSNAESTVLDCIYSDADKTYYILDLMCWNGHPVYNTETEFRFFWLLGKKDENPEMMEISKINPLCFVPLPCYPCDKSSLEAALATKETSLDTALSTKAKMKLDGLLFYHKRTHYLFGSTPLVLWLKPHMLPEILGVPVPGELMADAPASYSDFATHVEKVKRDKEMARERQSGTPVDTRRSGRNRKWIKESKMEVTHSEQLDPENIDDEPNRKCKNNRRTRRKAKREEMEVTLESLDVKQEEME